MPRAPKTIIEIDLADTPYAEYKVRAGSISLGKLLELGDQPDRLRAGAGLGAVRELVDQFAQRIDSWNLDDDDDAPLPTTSEALLGLDFPFAVKLIVTWLDGMTNVDMSLGKGSSSGLPSAPPNFPMDPL